LFLDRLLFTRRCDPGFPALATLTGTIAAGVPTIWQIHFYDLTAFQHWTCGGFTISSIPKNSVVFLESGQNPSEV
jgi:hypothetical protein